jgi:F-box/leucine-rich repeat protein 2/20
LFFQGLKKCQKIRVVDIDNSRNIWNAQALRLSLPETTKILELKKMDLSEEIILALADTCPNLEKLILKKCHLELPALKMIGTKFCNLQYLCLSLMNGLDQQLLQAFNDSSSWKDLSTLILFSAKNLTDSGLRMLSQSGPRLTSACFTGAKFISDAGMAAFISQHSGMEQLCTDNSFLLGDSTVAVAAINCSNLTSLSLSNSQITDLGLDALAKAKPPLTSLALTGNRRFTSEGFVALIEQCPNLTNVHIDKCFQLRDEAIIGLAKFCPKLKTLVVQCLPIQDTSLFSLAEAQLPLEELALSQCKSITNKGLTKLLQSCAMLNILAIAGSPQIGDESVVELSKHCHHLTKLDLSALNLTDVSLTALAEARLSLEYLCLINCKALTDKGLAHLISRCPTLRELRVENLEHIGDATISKLINCHKLQYLDLSGTKVTDAGLALLGEAGLPHCKIWLDKCPNISDDGVASLVAKSPDFTTISVTCSKKIGDATITALAQSCLYLNTINLAETNVSNAGLMELSNSELPLENVNFRKCPNVDLDGVRALMDAYTSPLHLSSVEH